MILGALGSGFAFLLFGTLLKRTGTVRALIPTYFTPIVGTFLGVLFNDEKVLALSLIGMLIVILGAWLTSRPDLFLNNKLTLHHHGRIKPQTTPYIPPFLSDGY